MLKCDLTFNSATMEAHMKDFWEKGYTIFSGLVNDSIVDRVLTAAPRLKYASIFKQVFGDKLDGARLQAKFPVPSKPAFMDLNIAILRTIIKKVPNMKWKAAQWVVLKSLPGGEEQEAHHDFPSFEIGRAQAKYDSIQAGLMVGLMPNTNLVVYELCFTQTVMSKRKVIEFGPGGCVLFRGDLVHAGAVYTEINYRTHLTITVEDIERADNATEAAPVMQYKCKFCPTKYNLRV